MLVGLEGIIESRGSDSVVVAVGGASLKLYVPTSTLSTIGEIGSKVKLHTHLQVREDGVVLYGFASAQELELFQALTSVSGVGPKAALSLLSTLTVEQLTGAIVSGNAEVLNRVPGVGQKMAARLVLELKNKLPHIEVPSSLDAEVVAVLQSLGYSVAEATSALASVPDSSELTLEDKIKLALRNLAKA